MTSDIKPNKVWILEDVFQKGVRQLLKKINYCELPEKFKTIFRYMKTSFILF